MNESFGDKNSISRQNIMEEEKRNIQKFMKPKLIGPEIIIKRQVPITGSNFNPQTNYSYQFNDPKINENDQSQMIIYKNKKDAYLYFPFYWDDTRIELLIKQFIKRKLWNIIDSEDNEVTF